MQIWSKYRRDYLATGCLTAAFTLSGLIVWSVGVLGTTPGNARAILAHQEREASRENATAMASNFARSMRDLESDLDDYSRKLLLERTTNPSMGSGGSYDFRYAPSDKPRTIIEGLGVAGPSTPDAYWMTDPGVSLVPPLLVMTGGEEQDRPQPGDSPYDYRYYYVNLRDGRGALKIDRVLGRVWRCPAIEDLGWLGETSCAGGEELR